MRPALSQAMKPGSIIPGLDFLKDEEQIKSKDRSEYPPWVNDLVKDQTSLAALRKIENDDATLAEMKRFIKLSRRIKLKEKNADASAKN